MIVHPRFHSRKRQRLLLLLEMFRVDHNPEDPIAIWRSLAVEEFDVTSLKLG